MVTLWSLHSRRQRVYFEPEFDLLLETINAVRPALYFVDLNKLPTLIPSLNDITISKEDAVALAMKMKEKYAQIVVDTYP